MLKTYRHNSMVHLVIPAVILLELYVVYASFAFEGTMRGGELMRYGLILGASAVALFTAYVFVRFVLVKYHLTEDGILIEGFGRREVRAWEDVTSLRVNHYLKYLSVRDAENRLIIFSSTDYFRDIQEFIDEIQIHISPRGSPISESADSKD